MKLMQELIALSESSPDTAAYSVAGALKADLKLSDADSKVVAGWLQDEFEHLPLPLAKKLETHFSKDIDVLRDELSREYVRESACETKKDFDARQGRVDAAVKKMDAAKLERMKKIPGFNAAAELAKKKSVTEGAMKDLHIDLLDAIRNEFDSDDDMTAKIADWLLDGTDDKEVSEFLFNHFVNSGEMPYGTMKARTGDPDNWIADEMSDLFKKQMKAIWDAEKAAKAAPVKEDWGSSDWYAVFSSIEKDLKKGYDLEEAIRAAASFYHDSMGYDDVDDAVASIKRVAKARKYEWAAKF